MVQKEHLRQDQTECLLGNCTTTPPISACETVMNTRCKISSGQVDVHQLCGQATNSVHPVFGIFDVHTSRFARESDHQIFEVGGPNVHQL